MPSSRPGLSFDDSGLCSACRAYKNRRLVDYDKRWNQLEQLCDQYRGMNGPSSYDCMIAVSGGKDSHYQTHIMKKVLGMNPLLVSVEDNFKPGGFKFEVQQLMVAWCSTSPLRIILHAVISPQALCVAGG